MNVVVFVVVVVVVVVISRFWLSLLVEQQMVEPIVCSKLTPLSGLPSSQTSVLHGAQATAMIWRYFSRRRNFAQEQHAI